MDSNGNQEEPEIKSSKELDLNSFKDDLAAGLSTLDKTPELNYKAPLLLPTDLEDSLLPPIESSNTSANKKSNYIMVSNKEAEPKKKIVSNIGEQNIITRKRIKKQLKAYAGFLANITKE